MEWVIGAGILLFLAYSPVKRYIQNNGQNNGQMASHDRDHDMMNDHQKHDTGHKHSGGGCC